MNKLRWFAMGAGLIAIPLVAVAREMTTPPHFPPSAWQKKPGVIKVGPPAPSNRTASYIRNWKEKDAPKCIESKLLAGIMLNKPDAVDLVLRDKRIIRARLKKGCASVGFYSGLYLKPTKDGRLCEDRDVIHSPTGGTCEVKKFYTLTPPK